MSDTAARMLALLGLLQRRRAWTGSELAERLGVTDRTVRRDVDRLRELGYPVDSTPGVAGGYQLGRGGQLPPLLLGEEEAVAVALGIRGAIDGTVTGLEEAAQSVLERLDQLLPQHLAARVRALHESTSHVDVAGTTRIASEVLTGLGHACSRSVRVRFAYSDRTGRASDRLVEPYRLVLAATRWYLVAWDVDRHDWRTFRIDRLAELVVVGTPFTARPAPDPVAMVRDALNARSWPFEARLRVQADAEEVEKIMPFAIGIAAGEEHRCQVEVGAPSLERMVRYLAGLPLTFEVLDPLELRAALCAHAERVARANWGTAAAVQ